MLSSIFWRIRGLPTAGEHLLRPRPDGRRRWHPYCTLREARRKQPLYVGRRRPTRSGTAAWQGETHGVGEATSQASDRVGGRMREATRRSAMCPLLSLQIRARRPLRAAIVSLAAAALFLAAARQATAQSCPTDSVFLSGSTGDGSTFPAPQGIQIFVRGPGVPGWSPYSGFAPPSETLTAFHPGLGTWDLQGQNFAYFTPPPANGAVTCNDDPDPCAFHCTGSASFVLYALQGSISGSVTLVPEG